MIPDQVLVELDDQDTRRGTVVRRNDRELAVEFSSEAVPRAA